MSSVDPPAPQDISVALMAPYYSGWCAQILFSGAAFTLYWSFLSSSRFVALKRRTRWTAHAVVALNTICLVFAWAAVVHWGTSQARTENDLFGVWILDSLAPLPSVLIATIVQGTYAQRAYVLFPNKIGKMAFAAVVVLCILTEWLGAMTTLTWQLHLYLTGNVDTSSYFGPWYLSNTSAIWFMSAAAVDVLISVTLFVLLRSRVAGFNRATDSLLWRLGRLAFQSASYTAVMALLAAVLSVGLNGDDVYVADIPAAFWVPLPSLYTLSIFVTLSAQDKLAAEHRRGTTAGFGPTATHQTANFVATGANGGFSSTGGVVSGTGGVGGGGGGGRHGWPTMSQTIQSGMRTFTIGALNGTAGSKWGGQRSTSKDSRGSGIEVEVEIDVSEDVDNEPRDIVEDDRTTTAALVVVPGERIGFQNGESYFPGMRRASESPV